MTMAYLCIVWSLSWDAAALKTINLRYGYEILMHNWINRLQHIWFIKFFNPSINRNFKLKYLAKKFENSKIRWKSIFLKPIAGFIKLHPMETEERSKYFLLNFYQSPTTDAKNLFCWMPVYFLTHLICVQFEVGEKLISASRWTVVTQIEITNNISTVILHFSSFFEWRRTSSILINGVDAIDSMVYNPMLVSTQKKCWKSYR